MPPTTTTQGTTCSIDDPRVRSVLDRLYADNKTQGFALAQLGLQGLRDTVLRRKITVAEEAERLKELYVPLSPKQGRLAYMIARSIGARRIIEFGTSFAISTIHLAAAIRDNGGGTVIGTEMMPTKVATARSNLDAAGLAEYVEIRCGDARETLANASEPIDMVLLDGAKELYLPILELLTPQLHQGSVVLADNIFIFRKALGPYVTYMQDPANGFSSVTLFLASGTEYSVRL